MEEKLLNLRSRIEKRIFGWLDPTWDHNFKRKLSKDWIDQLSEEHLKVFEQRFGQIKKHKTVNHFVNFPRDMKYRNVHINLDTLLCTFRAFGIKPDLFKKMNGYYRKEYDNTILIIMNS